MLSMRLLCRLNHGKVYLHLANKLLKGLSRKASNSARNSPTLFTDKTVADIVACSKCLVDSHRLYAQHKSLLRNCIRVLEHLYRPNLDLVAFDEEKIANFIPHLNQFVLQLQSFNEKFTVFADVCITIDELSRVIGSLKRARLQSRNSRHVQMGHLIVDCKIYEVILADVASKGDWPTYTLLRSWMQEDGLIPSASVYLSGLECLGRMHQQHSDTEARIRAEVRLLLAEVKTRYINIYEAFLEYAHNNHSLNHMLTAILLYSNETPQLNYFSRQNAAPSKSICRIIEHTPFSGTNAFSGVFSDTSQLTRQFQRQSALECRGHMLVDLISPLDGSKFVPTTKLQKNHAEALSTEKLIWRSSLTEAFRNRLLQLQRAHGHGKITAYPFLKVLPLDDYVNLVVDCVDDIVNDCYFQFTNANIVSRELGNRVEHACKVWRYKNGSGEQYMNALYRTFSESCDEQTIGLPTFRELWLSALQRNIQNVGESMQFVPPWGSNIRFMVGRELYMLMFDCVKFNLQYKTPSVRRNEIPAFYEVLTELEGKMERQLRVHPTLAHLYKSAVQQQIRFAPTELPMLCPPVPRINRRQAGYIISTSYATHLIRKSFTGPGAEAASLDGMDFSPDSILEIYEALNVLSACPWRVNGDMVDVMTAVARNRGDHKLAIFVPTQQKPTLPPKSAVFADNKERARAYRQAYQDIKEFNETRALWASTLYCLSIGNQFRDEVFYFPHSMDFRGRVYPCPPHFTYMGNDLSRGMLTFAKSVLLGSKGFDWLLIHLTNLTGMRKKSSNAARLDFAKSILDEVLDSAENPLTGRMWWREQEEPWQVLACCKEIYRALRHPGGPAGYASRFPVHQDGSCNGLQHYAALGRDLKGAESVNLRPLDLPKDVYGDVVEIVGPYVALKKI